MFGYLSGWLSDPVSMLRTLVLSLPGLCIGLTVHEWAHAFVAYKLGDPTAKNFGRMSLNPLAHLDPVGGLCLLFFGFGWAKPVPISTRNLKHYRRDDILISLAGITMNFLVAFVFAFIETALLVWAPGILSRPAIIVILNTIVTINLSLMIFNLIPLYPLDGSHVLECLCMRRLRKLCVFLRNYGFYILLALLVLGLVSEVLSPAVTWISNLMFRVSLFLLGRG